MRFLRAAWAPGRRRLVAGLVFAAVTVAACLLVGQRLTTTTQQATTSVFVQLELNGLARVGTSPLDLLRRSVPGYVPTNDPSLRERDRRLEALPEF